MKTIKCSILITIFYKTTFSGLGELINFPNTIFFKAHKWITRLFFNNTQQRKFLFAALRRFVLGAAKLVVVRHVGCLRRNGLARCWNGSVSLDVWGKYSKSQCSFVSRVEWRSDRHSKFLWCLWKACWTYLIHIQLGFLGLKYIRRKESIN